MHLRLQQQWQLENAKKKRNNIRYKACIERRLDYTGLRIELSLQWVYKGECECESDRGLCSMRPN